MVLIGDQIWTWQIISIGFSEIFQMWSCGENSCAERLLDQRWEMKIETYQWFPLFLWLVPISKSMCWDMWMKCSRGENSMRWEFARSAVGNEDWNVSMVPVVPSVCYHIEQCVLRYENESKYFRKSRANWIKPEMMADLKSESCLLGRS